MTGDRWLKVKVALERLRELTEPEREARIGECCHGDVDMEREVRELLAAHDAAEEFLGEPALSDQKSGAQELFDRLWKGRILGRYRIVRHIGDGGMGSVFEAERADGEFQQKVAIKVVRQGLETAALVERFRKERQILAGLSHPNIARLIDGGTTEEGLPFLVMEYVEGRSINAYCEEQELDPAARLRLFQAVCLAVQHAHEQRVVHRDIKPNNIVVDRGGTPKLLDFGIAKLVSEDGESTSASARLATPNYASPEQVKGATATARSDVYSLGVTLYELLARRHPFRAPGRTPHDVAIAICEEEAKPLSQTGGTPAALDKIVRQAMAKDPAARYESAQAMADDIQRYLEGGVVHARVPGSGFRLAWLAVTSAALLVVAGLAVWRGIAKEPRSIAVVHVENLTHNADLDWFDRGLSELLTTNLAMANGFEVVSTERVRGVMRHINKNEQIASAQAADVARQAQAEYFVTGALLQLSNGLRLDLRVQDTASGRVLFADKYEGAEARAIFAMADQAAAAILARLGVARATQAPDAAKVMTSNVEALRLYEEARRFFDRFQFQLAFPKVDQAIQIDPDFAMAYYLRGSMHVGWRIWLARESMAKAAGKARLRNLPRLQQDTIRQAQLMLDGRIEEALALGNQLHAAFPRETEPLSLAASMHFQLWNPPAAIATLQELLKLDPKDPNGAMGLSISFALKGDNPAADSWAERYCALVDPGDWNCDDLRGDVAVLKSLLRESIPLYARSQGKALMGHIKAAISHMLLDEYNDAVKLVDDALVHAPKLPNVPPITAFVRANIAASQGRWDKAIEHYEGSARAYANLEFRFDQLWKIAEYYFETGHPEKALDLASRFETPWIAAIRGVAHHLRKDSAAEETEWTALRASLTPVLGEYMAVRQERLYRLLAHSFAGEHEEVLKALPEVPRLLLYHLSYAVPVGRAYLAKGELEKAREQFQFAWDARPYFGGPQMFEEHRPLRYLLARYYLGRLATAKGKPDEARQHRRYFLAHLGTSDSELPQVRQALREQ